IGRERYRVPKRLRQWLRIKDKTCTFTGCMNVTAHTQLDHLKAFEHGGSTEEANLADECKRHHLVKHLRDGKDRHGRRKPPPDAGSETGVGADPPLWVRGWTPTMTESGLPSWTAPSGRTYPPPPPDFSPPELPEAFTAHPGRTADARDAQNAGEARPPWPALPEDPEAGTWRQHLSLEEPPDPANEDHDEADGDDGHPRQHPDAA
ncbi:MAG: HNH endonuclease, partial [Actinomycetota bacterium]|nr:HNH endonuclease [Actinomycetota bacterium]